LAYLFSNAGQFLVKDHKIVSEQKVERYFSKHLRAIYKPDKVGSLTKNNSDGKSRASAIVSVSHSYKNIYVKGDEFHHTGEIKWEFIFSNRAKDNIVQDKTQDKLTDTALNNKSVRHAQLYFISL